jgi:hypothetical protein
MKLRQPIFEFYAANATSDLGQEGLSNNGRRFPKRPQWQERIELNLDLEDWKWRLDGC